MESPESLTDEYRLPRFGKTKLDWSCDFSLRPVVVKEDGNIEIRGICYNTGKSTWLNPEASDKLTFFIGPKLFSETSSEIVWESRVKLPRAEILPGGSFFFDFEIIPEEIDKGKTYFLDLDMVKEGKFWFRDKGCKLHRFRFTWPEDSKENPSDVLNSFSEENLRKIEASFLQYRAEFLIEEPFLKDGFLLDLKGTVTNRGTLCWDNQSVESGHEYRVGLTVLRVGGANEVLWETRYELPHKLIESGESVNFQFLHKLSEFKGENLIIELDIVKEQEFWFRGQGALPLRFNIKIPDVLPKGDRKFYDCEFEIKDPILRRGILLISGTAINNGLFAWNNEGEAHDKHIRVALTLYKKGNTGDVLQEHRYELPLDCIDVDERVEFNFNISTFGLEKGEYEIEIDVLKESVFWFHENPNTRLHIEYTQTSSPQIILEPEQLGPNARKFLMELENASFLVISPLLPLFDKETGGKRMFELLRILREKKVDITFLYDHEGVQDAKPYLDALEEMQIATSKGPLGFLAERPNLNFDACILAWHECAKKYMPTIRNLLPDTKIIVDSVDAHWIRERRAFDAGESQYSEVELNSRKSQELNTYGSADLVWLVTDADREALISERPGIKTRVIPVLSVKERRYIRNPKGNTVLFVGNFKHPPNESAALWGAEICERFRQETAFPLTYAIVGRSPTPAIQSLHNGNEIIVYGEVKDLYPYYRNARLMLCPLKSGAGMKGKLCESVCFGIPVATTDIGNEGINFEDKTEAFIANTTEEFVQALKAVFIGDTDLRKINERALERVLRLTGPTALEEPLQSSIQCRPVVISIVTFNQSELLRRCLFSVLTRTDYPNFKVAVVCNGANDDTKRVINDFRHPFRDRLDVYEFTENQYFVKPNNFVINQYKDRDIVLMNDDIEIIDEHWLRHLFDAAYISPFIGAAGGKILSADRKISEAGGEMYKNGRGRNLGRGAESDSPEFNFQRYVGFVSGCLLYMKRSAIEQCGMLDEDFHPMYYEDVAWQYTLHMAGLKTIYEPSCTAIHREGSTAGTDINSGMKRFQEVNRSKFLEKFSGINIEEYNHQ